jgi:hypothetical protein
MYSDNSNTTTVHGLEFKIHAVLWNSKMEPMQPSIRKQRLGLPKNFDAPSEICILLMLILI